MRGAAGIYASLTMLGDILLPLRIVGLDMPELSLRAPVMGFATMVARTFGTPDCVQRRGANRSLLPVLGGLLLLAMESFFQTSPANAVPSFAIQTGQPCAICHVGAFGPQLKPYGRDFKLRGYVASDGQDKSLPLAATALTSFTRTAVPQPGGAAPGFLPNDNFALDELAIYYGGRITPQVGAFIEATYDGVTRKTALGNVDIRHAREVELWGKDAIAGVTLNNSPTVQDLWSSTPAWGFPFSGSALARKPIASTLIDGGLGQRVVGTSAYVLWNDLLYMEAGGYQGLSADLLTATGAGPVAGSDRTRGAIPYWRLALMWEWEKHLVHVGTFGLAGNIIPGGNQTFGLVDRVTDVAFDASYQYISERKKSTSDMLSVNASYIRETGRMEASQALTGALLHRSLDTMRFDISYSFAATITGSFQYFRTTGTTDVNYWSTPNGNPKSDGMIFELAYVPWGKPDSPIPGLNAKLAVQYVDYLSFDGSRTNASRNNSLYLYLKTGLKL